MTADRFSNRQWAERAAERSPTVRRSRDRSVQQATQIVDAALELIDEKGSAFTIQELAKRAHIALQTFYRQFAGKDELLLAIIEQTISHSMALYSSRAAHLTDPLDRLQCFVTAALTSLDEPGLDRQRRFMTAEHYRLHQIFPQQLTHANHAFTALLIPEIRAAAQAGQLSPNDVESDAWFVTELVMATFHHYAYASSTESAADLAERVWSFCLAALGGEPQAPSSTRTTDARSGAPGKPRGNEAVAAVAARGTGASSVPQSSSKRASRRRH